MSSKFPEAIPVSDISSVSVTDALLNIFSRMGFPREIQCDQGTSFTSALTTEFFERFEYLSGIVLCIIHRVTPVERFHRTLKRLLRVLCLDAGPNGTNIFRQFFQRYELYRTKVQGIHRQSWCMGKICEPQRR
ncbi:retrovirus-related Pol polyprotein from transposon 412 [Trichonephila clavipes]|uniref:Retrovirus-related Pol polyprotein from transposon 412 n=1 Tax=Trichonephila clavipes TaxID=2585209 RepID=A0A8X6V423_TRICX|nr:retrovirus-related Pol polyprotein from transposon 412 [Trichonephila clavipes]